MRGHPSLREALFLLSLAVVPLGLHAQCCCTDIGLLIPIDHLPWVHSDREFEVKETRGQYTFHRVDKDSTDGRIDLLLDRKVGSSRPGLQGGAQQRQPEVWRA